MNSWMKCRLYTTVVNANFANIGTGRVLFFFRFFRTDFFEKSANFFFRKNRKIFFFEEGLALIDVLQHTKRAHWIVVQFVCRLDVSSRSAVSFIVVISVDILNALVTRYTIRKTDRLS